jgi:hypothetical protein
MAIAPGTYNISLQRRAGQKPLSVAKESVRILTVAN